MLAGLSVTPHAQCSSMYLEVDASGFYSDHSLNDQSYYLKAILGVAIQKLYAHEPSALLGINGVHQEKVVDDQA